MALENPAAPNGKEREPRDNNDVRDSGQRILSDHHGAIKCG